MAEIREIKVPDIGSDEVDVVEVLVAVGDEVAVDDSLLALESDKASMEVPSSEAGKITEVKVKVGDKVQTGSVIALVETAAGDGTSPAKAKAKAEAPQAEAARKDETSDDTAAAQEPASGASAAPPSTPAQASSDRSIDDEAHRDAHASPAIRRFARELGVGLGDVQGSGRKGRILREDVQNYVKATLAQLQTGGTSAGAGIPPMPAIDFSKFGEVESKKLSRIRKVSATHLHRAWLHVPLVTQYDEADVTELEAFRKGHAAEAKQKGYKLTPLAFLLKACAAALKEYPDFNSSLAPDGENLIVKKYVHIGVAVDTPDGLVVPVIRDVDQKGLYQLAEEVVAASVKARDKKLTPGDLQGGCFSISSLGGIGGTNFTPLVNAPEVAILGVARNAMKPIWDTDKGEFVPRLMMPLALSYDHRVIDGAAGARFITYLSSLLTDMRRLLL